MKIYRKLLSWKKQGKDITIVNADFQSHRTSYKIIAIHRFSKIIELASNSENLSERILLNIKSISMTIEDEKWDDVTIWL